MDSKAAVVVGGNVQGDITSCEIKDMVVSVERGSVFSFTQKTSHFVYNVCTKEEVGKYAVPELTDMGIIGVMVGLILFFVFAFAGAVWLANR